MRARFHGDDAVGVGNLVLHEFDAARLLPTMLAILLYPLLGMNNAIMNDSSDLKPVRHCGINVENTPTTVPEFVGERLPGQLPHGSKSQCSLDR